MNENDRLPSVHLQKAVEQISSLPGIGSRTALRMVLHLMDREKEQLVDFAQSIVDLKERVKRCQRCYNVSDTMLCGICADEKRDQKTLCVVADLRDVIALESTGQYKGQYHILGGIISPMDGVGPSDLTIKELEERVQNDDIHEVILALSTTMEGDTTNFYISKRIGDVKISVLSKGIGIGSELQYTDGVTLGRSLVNRVPFSHKV